MDHNLSVSVIIPAYNAANSLSRCLDSVFQQQHRPTQVIVIDDGSTDATLTLAKSHGPKVQVTSQENKGQGAARNAGLEVAHGSFIAFLDADDYWLPDFLKETVAFLAVHPEAVAVSTGYAVNKGGRQYTGPAGLLAASPGHENGYLLDSFFDTWAKHDHVRTGTVLMRRSVIEQAGPQLEIRISQDLEYWGYLATFGPWGFIPKSLWVGDSYSHAMQVGWLARYQKRRKACPTVEEWQQRIVPCLKMADWPGFRIVRGRVATHFAHSMIVAGNKEAARRTVAEYGADMGAGRLARVLRLGYRYGFFGWRSACAAIKLREYAKACSIIPLKTT